MRISLAVLVFVSATLVQFTSAQTRPVAPDEYIQATSPLRTGGVITGNTVAGTSYQKMITIIQPPSSQQVPTVVPANASQFRVASVQAVNPNIARQQAPVLSPPQNQWNSFLATSQRKFLRFQQTAFQPRAPAPTVTTPMVQNYNYVPPAPTVQMQPAPVPQANYQRQVVQVAPQPVPMGHLYVPGTSLTGRPIVAPNQIPKTPVSTRTRWASGL